MSNVDKLVAAGARVASGNGSAGSSGSAFPDAIRPPPHRVERADGIPSRFRWTPVAPPILEDTPSSGLKCDSTHRWPAMAAERDRPCGNVVAGSMAGGGQAYGSTGLVRIVAALYS